MLNKVILMGRLGEEPELRQTPSNTPVCSFGLAVQRPRYKEKEPETDWIDVVAWNKTAEFVCKWFHKGMLVAVDGRLQTRVWEDKQGNRRKSTEVVAGEVYFAEPKKETRQDVGPTEEEWREINDDSDLPF